MLPKRIPPITTVAFQTPFSNLLAVNIPRQSNMAKDRLKRGEMADSGEKIRLRITGDKVKV